MRKARLTLTAVLASATLATTSVVASADPDTVEEARRQLERIHQEASSLDQEIIEANDRVQKAEKRLKQLQGDLKNQEARVTKLGSEIGDLATFQMRSDSVSLTTQLLTSSSSDNFLSGLGVIQSETDRSNAQLQQLQLDKAKLTTLREDAAKTEKQLKQDRDAKVKLAKQFDRKESEAQGVYNRLSAEERQRLAALEARRAAEAEAAAAREERNNQSNTASRDRSTNNSNSNANNNSNSNNSNSNSNPNASDDNSSADNSSSAGSGRAQRAIQVAMAQVGKSYVWGTSGPRTFDCSGLMIYAYKSVGISLPRSSRAQAASAGRSVSRSELQPGDLVFFYSPVSHVGMYIGGGKIVHASNPRTGVKVASMSGMKYNSARRVVG